MSRRPAKFTEAEMRSALKVAKQTYGEGATIALMPDGALRLVPPSELEPPPPKPNTDCVYFIHSEHGAVVKIGWSSNVHQRLASLNQYSPVPLTLTATFPGGLPDERKMHERFAHLRKHGEWFAASPELMDFIAELKAKTT